MVLDKVLKIVAMAMIVISSLAIVSYSSQAMGLVNQPIPKAKLTGNVIANESSINETSGVAMFTDDEVSSHNSQDSCWMIIDGNVYDVTFYMPMHPVGGPMMLPYCGKDATSAFASIHSADAYNILNDYYIGSVGVAKKGNQTVEPIKKTVDIALKNKTSANNIQNEVVDDVQNTTTTSVVTYAASDVAQHNSQSNCWMIVGGGVYDVTTYIQYHPGGPSTILPYCGRDATSIFASTHTSSGYTVLNGYMIGITSAPTQVCTPNWSSGAWSACAAGIQTREVTDGNNCGNNTGKPLTAQACTMPTSDSTQNNIASYTISNVAFHNTQSDCWMVIGDGVYDVTSYISSHPGGSSMVSYCGANATSIFASLHTPAGYTVLDGYKIGSIDAAVCTPNWLAGSWSACVGGIQTRTVADINYCSITTGQPSTVQACTMPTTNTTQNNNTSNTAQSNTTNSSQNIAVTYTLSNVAQHSTQSSCWMIVGGGVYDVTSYLPIHPAGASAIVSYCGTNATSIFASLHTSAGYTALNGYFIGNLASTNNQTNITTRTRNDDDD